jgi:hypothetical protein
MEAWTNRVVQLKSKDEPNKFAPKKVRVQLTFELHRIYF